MSELYGLWKSKKNVGLKAFFPELSSNMSIKEKAEIWVKRHTSNYFVGWTQEQLDNVEPLIRPLTLINAELYKRHMNRSEYGRIVKLKFCLESDADWAKEFRDRLSLDTADGGFKGLGEAKLLASDLWRNHSELYDAQRARCITSSSLSPSSTKSPAKRCKTEKASKRSKSSKCVKKNGRKRASNVETSALCVSSLNKVSRLIDNVEVKTEVLEQNLLELEPIPLEIFPKLEELDIPLKEKVDILRERHDFLLNWNESQLNTVSMYARPYVPVDQDMYQRYLETEDGLTCMAVTTVYNIHETWAENFRKRIDLSPNEGGFVNFAELLSEADRLLNEYVNPNETPPDLGLPITSVKPPRNSPSTHATPLIEYNGMCIYKARKANSQETTTGRAACEARLSSSLSPCHSDKCECPYNEMSDSAICENGMICKNKMEIYHNGTSEMFMKPAQCHCGDRPAKSAVKISNPNLDGNSSCSTQSFRSPSKKSPSKKLFPGSTTHLESDNSPPKIHSTNLASGAEIWQLRGEIVHQCQESLTDSWHDRLRPHLPTLRQHLGERYTLPSSVAECMADLVLVTLHGCLNRNVHIPNGV